MWELTVQDVGKKVDMSWAMNRYMEHGDPEIVGRADSWCSRAREKVGERVVEEKVLKGERRRVIFIWPPEHPLSETKVGDTLGFNNYHAFCVQIIYTFLMGLGINNNYCTVHIITHLAFVMGISFP